MEEKKPTAIEELERLQEETAEEIAAIKVDVAKAQGNYELPLAWPIQVGTETRASLTFRQQTIRDIRVHKGDDEFTAALCGLTVDHIQQLCVDDWNATQAVIEGFTLRRVASGRKRKG
jgi:hypothetical protein